jgi:hypothetical protein
MLCLDHILRKTRTSLIYGITVLLFLFIRFSVHVSLLRAADGIKVLHFPLSLLYTVVTLLPGSTDFTVWGYSITIFSLVFEYFISHMPVEVFFMAVILSY